MAEGILPVIKWFTILLLLLRVFVFMVALKKPEACRFYFYIEVMICALAAFAPRSAHQDWDYMTQNYFLMTMINFCAFYCMQLLAESHQQLLSQHLCASVRSDDL